MLVSTTIIETGLDISNANTMIIHDADRLGTFSNVPAAGGVWEDPIGWRMHFSCTEETSC